MQDAHFLVIDGRRWRRQDPNIPEKLAHELVAALMDARRAVLRAKRAHDDEALRQARRRVNDAKVALGERGAPWWEAMRPEQRASRIEASVRTLLVRRGPGKTICPSEAARVVAGARFRPVMQEVRDVVQRMESAGELVVMQRGKRVAAAEARGPIRLALPR